MGQGIDAARSFAPEHAAALDNLKDQLLIVFLKRLKAQGDDLHFSLAEVDGTGKDTLSFQIVDGTFVFNLGQKS